MKNTPPRPNSSACPLVLRIYDKKNHEWLGEHNDNLIPYYGFDPCCGEVVLFQRWPLDHREWDFLEADYSTGIKDKNGTVIYEHDIVITLDGHDFAENPYVYIILWEVIFEYARFVLRPLNCLDENYRKDFFDYNNPTEEWEVVGHTHEKLPKWFCENCGHFFDTGKFSEEDSNIYDDICPLCGAECSPTKKPN